MIDLQPNYKLMFFQDYEHVLRDPEALGQIIGAIIGVTGLFLGTFITIITSLLIRYLDVKRDQRRDDFLRKREQLSREYKLKRDVYTAFISDLAQLESFVTKGFDETEKLQDFENFEQEWTKTEIRLNLIGSDSILNLENELQSELFSLAKKRFSKKDGDIQLTDEYMYKRTELLEAIRQDMGINKND